MEQPVVRYRSGYRFQLAETFQCATPIIEPCPGNHFVGLSADGTLTIAAGYAWDGASGPIEQGPQIVRGSLVHDALYQLMRECGLPAKWREPADHLLRVMFEADGLHPWMAAAAFKAVRLLGGQFIAPGAARPLLMAPMFNAEPIPEPYLP